jgi:hypothetical protein
MASTVGVAATAGVCQAGSELISLATTICEILVCAGGASVEVQKLLGS